MYPWPWLGSIFIDRHKRKGWCDMIYKPSHKRSRLAHFSLLRRRRHLSSSFHIHSFSIYSTRLWGVYRTPSSNLWLSAMVEAMIMKTDQRKMRLSSTIFQVPNSNACNSFFIHRWWMDIVRFSECRSNQILTLPKQTKLIGLKQKY